METTSHYCEQASTFKIPKTGTTFRVDASHDLVFGPKTLFGQLRDQLGASAVKKALFFYPSVFRPWVFPCVEYLTLMINSLQAVLMMRVRVVMCRVSFGGMILTS